MPTFRQLRHLTRFVLVWFALSLGVAMASSLVAPKATQLVCSSGGAIKVVQADGDDEAGSSHHLDCALCMAVALPPSPSSVQTAPVFPFPMPCKLLQRRILRRLPRRRCLLADLPPNSDRPLFP